MMATTKNPAPGRDEIEMLLPWHAAGTLNREDAARVEAALAQDEELARRFELVREELAETIAVNEQLGAPSTAGMERLFARIETQSRRPSRIAPAGLADRFDGFFSRMPPRALVWSAAAAILVIVVQAGLLAGLFLGERPGPQTYQTASQGDAASLGEGKFAIVRFDSGATAAEIGRVLGQFNASIVDGPRAGGLYRVRVGGADLPPDEFAKIVARMQEEKNVIRLVAPAD